MNRRAPQSTVNAIRQAATAGLAPLRAEPPLPLSTWAEQHFQMPAESSHATGAWVPFPFQRAMMDAMSNDDIFEVDVEKSKRVGYTKALTAFIAYNAAHRRRKQAIWQPSDADRDSFVKSEISPALELCKAMKPVRRSGRDDDTMQFKRYRGSALHLLGGKSAKNFRRITIAVAMIDEFDAFDQIVENSIHPFTGAVGRLEGAAFPKIVCGSTPRVKLTSHIRRRVDLADAAMRFEIPCPHCATWHPLTWGGADLAHGFKWENNDPNTIRHVCPHCREAITQSDYLATWHTGQWISKCGQYTYDDTRQIWLDGAGQPRSAPRHVAFAGLWSAYSPQRSWSDIVVEFMQARQAQKAGDSGPMQGFVNETLGDVWAETFEHTDASVLRERAKTDIDIPLQIVPPGACKILMGIDTQADRWEAVTWAIGRGEEMWPIDYRVVYGLPAQQSEWAEKLDPLIKTIYKHAHGHEMKIDAIGIDTGGSNWTHQAYNYCRERSYQRVYATKGDGALGAPIKMKPSYIDINIMGRILKRGIKLWRICTDSAKDLLHGRLEQVKQPGPGYVHLNRNLPPEFFDQLSAEHRIRVRSAHGWAERWVCPSGHRNEVLDCTVISIFLCQVLGLHNTPQTTWEMWEKQLSADLFTPPALPEPQRSGVVTITVNPGKPDKKPIEEFDDIFTAIPLY